MEAPIEFYEERCTLTITAIIKRFELVTEADYGKVISESFIAARTWRFFWLMRCFRRWYHWFRNADVALGRWISRQGVLTYALWLRREVLRTIRIALIAICLICRSLYYCLPCRTFYSALNHIFKKSSRVSMILIVLLLWKFLSAMDDWQGNWDQIRQPWLSSCLIRETQDCPYQLKLRSNRL